MGSVRCGGGERVYPPAVDAPKNPGRLSRFAKVLRWTMIIASVLLAIVFVLSVWFKVSVSTGEGLWVGVGSGELRMLGINDSGPKPAYMATAYVKFERNDVPFGWGGQYKQFGRPNLEYPSGPPKSALPPGVPTSRLAARPAPVGAAVLLRDAGGPDRDRRASRGGARQARALSAVRLQPQRPGQHHDTMPRVRHGAHVPQEVILSASSASRR
jgi:hypothetical protein